MFTKLQKEIINFRLDEPHAMAECIEDEYPLLFVSTNAYVKAIEERSQNLIEKLCQNVELDFIEILMVKDIAQDECFIDLTYQAVDEYLYKNYPEQYVSKQKFQATERAYNDLVKKLNSILSTNEEV